MIRLLSTQLLCRKRRSSRPPLAAAKWLGLVVTAFFLLAPLGAFAQQGSDGFVKVPDKDVESIAANPFIAAAYSFIWVAVVVYLVWMARSLKKTNQEIAALTRKLEED